MKKIYLKPTAFMLVILGLCVTHFSFSQSVSINTTGAAAHGSAGLDVNFSDKGVLIPRVKLTATNVVAPISTTPTTSLLVFNTNTAGSGATQVTPGYYYWAGEWKRLIDSDNLAGSFWKTDGNSGTNITNNFIGTTDNNGLMVRTNNTNSFEFNTSGQILSNTTGSASAPTYGWRSNLSNGLSTGMFRSSATRLGFTVAGAHMLDLLNAIDGSKQLLSQVNGTASRPFYSFESSIYSGMWTPGANILSFSTNQTERFRIPNANQVHAMANGTAASPFYSWASNTNTGMFRPTTNQLAFSTGGTERVRVSSNGNVGIGTTSPNAGALLDVVASNKGVLIPRVALSATNSNAPIGSSVTNSMLVYNTVTAGSYPNDVYPGFYFWQNSKWNRMESRNIRVFYYPPTTISALTTYTITGTMPGISNTDAVTINLVGNWGSAPNIVVEHVEARTGEVRFKVRNTGLTNYNGMDFCIISIKPF